MDVSVMLMTLELIYEVMILLLTHINKDAILKRDMDVTDTDLMCDTRLKTQNALHDKVTDMRMGGSNRGRGL